MRWEIVKQAWKMAKQAFPKATRIYVDIPPRFSFKGACQVMDLDKDCSLGEIMYSVVGLQGKPTLVLQLGDQIKQAALDQVAIEMKVGTTDTKIPKLGGKDVLVGVSPEVIGQRGAVLACAHATSPFLGKDTIASPSLRAWLVKEGFAEDTIPYVSESLKSMGIAVTGFNFRGAKRNRHKQPLYQQQAIVRIVDPNMRDQNKCGRVVQVSKQGKDKDKKQYFAYLVMVDGTSKPVWFAEWQLVLNHAGYIPAAAAPMQAIASEQKVPSGGDQNA